MEDGKAAKPSLLRFVANNKYAGYVLVILTLTYLLNQVRWGLRAKHSCAEFRSSRAFCSPCADAHDSLQVDRYEYSVTKIDFVTTVDYGLISGPLFTSECARRVAARLR